MVKYNYLPDIAGSYKFTMNTKEFEEFKEFTNKDGAFPNLKDYLTVLSVTENVELNVESGTVFFDSLIASVIAKFLHIKRDSENSDYKSKMSEVIGNYIKNQERYPKTEKELEDYNELELEDYNENPLMIEDISFWHEVDHDFFDFQRVNGEYIGMEALSFFDFLFVNKISYNHNDILGGYDAYLTICASDEPSLFFSFGNRIMIPCEIDKLKEVLKGIDYIEVSEVPDSMRKLSSINCAEYTDTKNFFEYLPFYYRAIGILNSHYESFDGRFVKIESKASFDYWD